MTNWKKCQLGQRETKYLGFMVGQGQIHLIMNKVEALQTYVRLRTKKGIWSSVGLVNYYRKIIPHFSEMVVPLIDLIKGVRGQEVRWMGEPRAAFKNIKKSLCEEPILFTPDFSKLFILETDV